MTKLSDIDILDYGNREAFYFEREYGIIDFFGAFYDEEALRWSKMPLLYAVAIGGKI